MPAMPQQLQHMARVTRRRAFLSTRASTKLDVVKVSPAAVNDFSHLLENENEYGIAKPMSMDAFRKENYQFKLHSLVEPPSLPYLHAR